MKLPLLGGLTAQRFLSTHWQKKPLLVRGAVTDFSTFLSPDDLAGLACSEELQSRLVLHTGGKKWGLEEGPFEEKRLQKLPKKGWSLLVQGVNTMVPEMDALLRQFNFIPNARLDDLMVSLAPDGGGVGPHFDSYDVFLLQGRGQRRWRISSQKDQSIIPDLPLRVLSQFKTDTEWVLEPGDMLYLPPQLAHWGIAMGDDCMTYSIGFRAPSAQELGTRFLGYLHEHLALEGMYEDPDLKPQQQPAELGDAMVRRVAAMLSKVAWTQDDVANFLGTYISEPKAHIIFDEPRPLAPAAFARRVERNGVKLDLRSQMLLHGNSVFINGERVEAKGKALASLEILANARAIPGGTKLGADVLAFLGDWYSKGYLVL